jgi:acetylglutamate kinase
MKPVLYVIKIGGQVVENAALLGPLLDAFAALPGFKVLVHGGGKRASELSRTLGIEPAMVDGRRITDVSTLDVVTMVYAGLINKNLVAGLQARSVNALGLSGADGNAILARRRAAGAIDYGFVGDVVSVNAALLNELMQGGRCPVCCPITHDGSGQLLNTNADTIASAIAVALTEYYSVRLWYCFEKPGVLLDPDDDGSVIATLTPDVYAEYRAQGIITAGMIPKLDNAFAAIRQGVESVVIANPENVFKGAGTMLTTLY